MSFREVLKKASLEDLKTYEKQLTEEIHLRQPKERGSYIATYSDGASRGNPGLAGAGWLLFDQNDEKLKEGFQFLGVCTNNEAEYRALLLALEEAHKKTNGAVRCFLDSELTVRQLNGRYAIKSENLLKFYRQVQERIKNFTSVTFTHVPREHSHLRLADKLANKAIDTEKGLK